MRTIKFRAWDAKNERMLYDVNPFATNVFSSSMRMLAGKPAKREDCTFEQFTGLKDRNGKEIYEGDVVEYGNRNIAIVKFEQGGYYPFAERYNDFGCPHGEDVVIVGNIHEKHEVLGESR